MEDKSVSKIFHPGGKLRILGPNNQEIEVVIEYAGPRFLWTNDLIKHGASTDLVDQILDARYGENNESYIFQVRIVGSKVEDAVSLTRVALVTRPKPVDQREAYRLQHLFDLEVIRVFKNRLSINCQGVDLAEGGIGFTTTEEFELEELLACKFSLGGHEYEIVGKVVRVRDIHENDMTFRIGVRFIIINENDRKKIRQYIYRQQTAKRAERAR